ncbi:Patellin-4 like [Heracleum sosnowskyi]|uniref:Patellin-4 like n=1 Tax=Heracleum sosnowskyi TaxID=360622 RepID=A0AAD8GYS3_9APIA|nr:Patellin-4 like [Heracleum sosnowskyi]
MSEDDVSIYFEAEDEPIYFEPAADVQEKNTESCVEETPVPLQTRYSKKKALLELRGKVENAILSEYILEEDKNGKQSGKVEENLRELTLWNIPLLPSKGHEGTDVILMKFLKARDLKAIEAFNMLQKALKWRRRLKIDKILDEDFGPDLENAGYIDSRDKKGHPVCYIAHGISGWKDIHKHKERSSVKVQKRVAFLRWNIKFMEKCIQHIDFRPDGAKSVFRVVDLYHAPANAIKELRFFFRRILIVFGENYPGIVFRYVFINVPLWIFAYYIIQLRRLSQKAKNKFLFVKSQKVTKTLLKFISPENLPVQYGGLKREVDDDFSSLDKVFQLKVKANAMRTIQIPVDKAGVTVVWDLTVVNHEVHYQEEFIPNDECSYRILVQKEHKMKSVRNSFHIREPGKIVLSVENHTIKKKKIFYRYTIKPTSTNFTL